MEKLTELYNKWHGSMPESAERLAGAGSNRQYYRFTAEDGTTVIGVVGTSRDENHAFVYLAQHFEQRQLPVPQVLAVSDDGLRYLQTDLGSVSLFDAVRGGREAGGRYNLEEQELLKRKIQLAEGGRRAQRGIHTKTRQGKAGNLQPAQPPYRILRA